MRIELRRFATLRPPSTDSAQEPETVLLPDDACISDLIAHLGIDPETVHLVMVDGRIEHDRSSPLHDGSRVALFPPVGGG